MQDRVTSNSMSDPASVLRYCTFFSKSRLAFFLLCRSSSAMNRNEYGRVAFFESSVSATGTSGIFTNVSQDSPSRVTRSVALLRFCEFPSLSRSVLVDMSLDDARHREPTF